MVMTMAGDRVAVSVVIGVPAMRLRLQLVLRWRGGWCCAWRCGSDKIAVIQLRRQKGCVGVVAAANDESVGGLGMV